jgi:hypothetical protein
MSSSCNAPADLTSLAACQPPLASVTTTNCAWKEFVTAIARRYAGRIQFYETWNEVNSYRWPATRYWSGTAGPGQTATQADALSSMAIMAKDAYSMIRAADPSARVLAPNFVGLGGVADFDAYFAQATDPGQYADIIPFHGYVDPFQEHAPERVIELIDAYKAKQSLRPSIRNKPLWDDEGGWGQQWDGPCGTNTPAAGPCIHDPDEEAAYAARFVLAHASHGVDRVYWFAWRNPWWGTIQCDEVGIPNHHFNIGCDRLSGQPQLSIAGVALREVNGWLTGARVETPCSNEGSIWTCGLRSDATGARGLVVWDAGGALGDPSHASAYSVPADFIGGTVRSLDGTRSPIGQVVSIGHKPVVLETR